MKFRLLLIILFIFFAFSCRKKIADDYAYYQPYKKDTATIIKLVSTIVIKDSLEFKKIGVDEIRPVDLNDKYFIVVASFSVEEYAIAMKVDLKKKGYKPDILLLNNDRWHKLAIGSYNNYNEAIEILNRIKQKEDIFSGARIVIK